MAASNDFAVLAAPPTIAPVNPDHPDRNKTPR